MKPLDLHLLRKSGALQGPFRRIRPTTVSLWRLAVRGFWNWWHGHAQPPTFNHDKELRK